MIKNRKLVSIIIPAFRKKKTIRKDVLRIKNVMEQLRHNFEIIIVVDGDIDGTGKAIRKIKSKKIHVFSYLHNQGKGYAIRYGINKSQGNIVGFIDSGMEINPNGIAMLIEHMEWYNADIIIGSKRHPASKVYYPKYRKIISKLAQIYIKILFGLKVTDTQAGIKLFKRSVLKDVFPRLIVKKFAFDIEVLAVAKYLGYNRIFEAPIELYFDHSTSTVSGSILPIMWYTFLDTLGIFYRMHILHFYAKKRLRRKVKRSSSKNISVSKFLNASYQNKKI